ncbi:MAG: DEAD/DEAH box helicase [Deltaproteobacteria bacterium]|nr:DEAD/DEAH box helicase [Deltaproteobacteria bacterium]
MQLTIAATFESLGLSKPTLKLIEQIGFETPTPIQAKLIPPALEGRDLIGLAETGSGKTAAFVLPIAEHLQHGRGLRGLILCPTREIALQTKKFLDLFGQHHHLVTACLIGGVKINPQIRELRSGPDILVATPGRLQDHLDRRNVRLDRVEQLVIDEADRMLDLGFLPQIRSIVREVPRDRQTMMFSATMSASIEGLARRYLIDPLRIDILPEGAVAEGITHHLYLVEEINKKPCLLALLRQEKGRTLVFLRTRLDTNWILRILEKEGHPAASIHSDKTQTERIAALEGFRSGEHRILVATDIASRGIDVQGIEHIINFDMPGSVEEYIHRAGRTARGSAIGTVSTIAVWSDKSMIQEIEAALGEKLPRCTIPGVEPYVEMKVKPFGRIGRRRRR